MTDLRISQTTEELADAAAAWLEHELLDRIRVAETCSIALSGGSAPGPVHARLARSGTIDWSSVLVFFGDERCVPPEDAGSNFRLARETLLDRAGVPPFNVFRMTAEAVEHEVAAEKYAELLPDPLDIVVLGMGDDGHTASLFPGAASLHETARKVLAVKGPAPYTERLTITPPVIAVARRVIMLASGERKAAAVKRALDPTTSPSEVPAAIARHAVWFIDRAAASLL